LNVEAMKPIDDFARDFLNFLKREVPGDWTRTEWKVKVLYWKGDWWTAHPILASCKIGNPGEYSNRPDISTEEGWQQVNAFYVLPPLGLSRTRRETSLLQHNFSLPAAEALATFDAVIIVNAAAVIARARRKMPFPDTMLVAHEVVHIAEQLSGSKIHIDQWDRSLYESPQVMNLFHKFVSGNFGGGDEFRVREFAKRYMAIPDS
jgi:hypothetical protein